ncbi:MAG: MotA/TolQ/ExbB proton channel family protein [Bacteroidales bacterium]|nr:MotA/TolQ/ExbB proton channel family protein [Bacteroidales bacterium]
MATLFYEGGILFMSILSLCLLIMLVLSVYYGVLVFRSESSSREMLRHRLTYIKSAGLLSLVIGILGQLIGLYSAFCKIQAVGSVSQSVLASGIKVSMITTLYGMIIFILSYLIWLILDSKVK